MNSPCIIIMYKCIKRTTMQFRAGSAFLQNLPKYNQTVNKFVCAYINRNTTPEQRAETLRSSPELSDGMYMEPHDEDMLNEETVTRAIHDDAIHTQVHAYIATLLLLYKPEKVWNKWMDDFMDKVISSASQSLINESSLFAVGAIIRTAVPYTPQYRVQKKYPMFAYIKKDICTVSGVHKHLEQYGFLDTYLCKTNNILSSIILSAASSTGIKYLVQIFSDLLITVGCLNQFDNLTFDEWKSLSECFDTADWKKICKTFHNKGYQPVTRKVTRKEWITLTKSEVTLSDSLEESEWGKFIKLITDNLTENGEVSNETHDKVTSKGEPLVNGFCSRKLHNIMTTSKDNEDWVYLLIRIAAYIVQIGKKIEQKKETAGHMTTFWDFVKWGSGMKDAIAADINNTMSEWFVNIAPPAVKAAIAGAADAAQGILQHWMQSVYNAYTSVEKDILLCQGAIAKYIVGTQVFGRSISMAPIATRDVRYLVGDWIRQLDERAYLKIDFINICLRYSYELDSFMETQKPTKQLKWLKWPHVRIAES